MSARFIYDKSDMIEVVRSGESHPLTKDITAGSVHVNSTQWEAEDLIAKFNENHDEAGRFATSDGSSGVNDGGNAVWASQVADDINAGKHPEIASSGYSTLLEEMAKRDDHPDITELKINGSLLIGGEGLGIARADMPQIPSDARPQFLSDLKERGITVEKEKVDPETLKPIQKEISGARVGAIYEKFKEDGGIPKEQRILVSKDNYVIDGHHTWAASIAYSFDDGSKLPVYRIGLDAREALATSLDWSKAHGYESQAIDGSVKKALFGESFELQDFDYAMLKYDGSHDDEIAKALGIHEPFDIFKTLAEGIENPFNILDFYKATTDSPKILTEIVDDGKPDQYTLAPYYVPNELDGHDEWVETRDLEKAVNEWSLFAANRNVFLQHDENVVAGTWTQLIVMPWEFECDLKNADGVLTKHLFPIGTVLIGVVWKDWAWEMILDGRITGMSMGGMAQEKSNTPPPEVVKKALEPIAEQLNETLDEEDTSIELSEIGLPEPVVEPAQPVVPVINIIMPDTKKSHRIIRDSDGNISQIIEE